MRFPQISLAMILYIVTAIGVMLGVDRATANTALNDPVGGAVAWLLVFGGIGLHFWRRSGRRRSNEG